MSSHHHPAMDSPPPTATTPPSRRAEARLLRSRTPPCLAQPFEDSCGNHNSPKNKSSISPSPLHLARHAASDHIPLQELLLLSHSPARRHKSRLLLQGENMDPAAATPRRKSKGRVAAAAANVGLMGCASPRNHVRRARRRLEKESNREERESGLFEDDPVKVRKRRQSRPRKEKSNLVPPVPSSITTPNSGDSRRGLDGLKELIMWSDVAKSSLWFGFGSLCFLSSCFPRDLSFCIISAVSHLGLLILALAFIHDSVSQRQQEKVRREFKLKEEEIMSAIRVILPTVNTAIALTQDVFSGEPSMTLKVAPVLLFAAKYGHLITLWRFLATGFFISFTVPKLYSSYSSQIQRQVDTMRRCVWEAWKARRHKRILAVTAATLLWNLFSVKTRIFAAFICVVILRYHRQQRHPGEEDGGGEGEGGDLRGGAQQPEDREGTQQRQALAVVEEESPMN